MHEIRPCSASSIPQQKQASNAGRQVFDVSMATAASELDIGLVLVVQMGNAVSPVVAGALGRCLAKAAAAASPAGEAVISVPDPVAEAVSDLHDVLCIHS